MAAAPSNYQNGARSVTSSARLPFVVAAAVFETAGLTLFVQTDMVVAGLAVWSIAGVPAGWAARDTEEGVGNAVVAAAAVFVVTTVIFAVWSSVQVGNLSMNYVLGEIMAIAILQTLFSYALIPLVVVSVVASKLGDIVGPR